MKKIFSTAILSLGLFFLAGCQDQLDNELFYKYSYLIKNGWKECELDIKEDNTTELLIDFGVNGTSGNDKDITITIAHDPDTLAQYNFEKFKNETKSYYNELPATCYTFDQESYTIPKGELRATAKISIDLNQIDNIYNSYVLPLHITSSKGEPIGPGKWSKLLAYIIPKNRFSGTFSGSGKVTIQLTGQSTNVGSAKLFASSPNSCYMYAGNANQDTDPEYRKYAIDLTYGENESITMSAKNKDLMFNPLKATIARKYILHNTDNRYYIQTSVLTLKYEYKNLSPEDSRMLVYEGTHTLIKNVLKSEYPNVTIEKQ